MKRLSPILITALALSSMSGSAPTRKAQSLDFRRTPGSRQRRQRKLNRQRGGR